MTTNDDATRKDAEDRDEDENIDELDEQLSERELAMERIAAAREVQATGVPDGQAAVTDDGEKKDKQEEAAQLVKVKLDGEEKEIPLSELVKGYQVHSVASKRMEEATILKQQATAELAEAEQLKEQLSRQAPLKKEGDEAGGGETDEVDDALDAYLEGDATKIRELLKKATGKKDAPASLSEEELDQVVEKRLAKRDTDREHKTAEDTFKKDYAEIFADPDLLAAANKRYYAKIDEGKSITDAMLEAGKETQDWLLSKAGVKRETIDTREDRLRKKSNLTSLPVRGGRSGAQVDDDNTPQNTSSVIAEIARSRAQVS